MVRRNLHLTVVSATMAAVCLAWAVGVQAQPASRSAPSSSDPARFPVNTTMSTEDVFLADAFIWRVFSRVDVVQYEAATRAYYTILEQLDRPLSPDEQAVVLKHLRPLSLVMSAPERASVNLDEAVARADPGLLPEGTGARLVQWWRRQDTLPATEGNERAEEHLMRVAVSTSQYGRDDDPYGFDDRGRVFVRLGSPSHNTSIDIRNADLLMDPLIPAIPNNELWVYEHLGDEAYFLFVQPSKKSAYRLGYSADLIPPELQGRSKVSRLLLFMEEVYARLALSHEAFGPSYDVLTTYLALPTSRANTLPPYTFAMNVLRQAHAEDTRNEWRRDRALPPSYSETYGQAEPLASSARWARFLDPDGTTRTEIYWGLEAAALSPSRKLLRTLRRQGHHPSEKYLLTAAVAHSTADYQVQGIQQKHFLLPVTSTSPLPARAFVVRGDTGRYVLSAQWNLQWTTADQQRPEALLPGVTLKIGTVRVDTLEALHGAGRRFEMSDLKPLMMTDKMQVGSAVPHPYPYLTPATPLALYFELYHLTYGADDQTHYTIDYQIVRKTGKREERTGSRTSYTGQGRTARELIALDPGALDAVDVIEIVVLATDDTTGEQVARSLSFAVKP